uniref:Uncharacterized protein n=1 Tax=Hanusia phi TaxID=3032 RepID=A0A7S0HHJ6_9CRYP
MKSGGKGKRLLCSPGKNNYPSAKNPDLLLDTKDGAEWDDVSNEINACSPKDLSSIELSVSEPRNTRSSRKTPSKKATEKEEQENAPEIQASLQQSKTPSRTRATVAAAAPAPVSTASLKSDSPVLTSPGPVTRSRSRRSITKPIELKAEEEKKAEESKEEEVKAEEELPAVMSDEHKVEAASAPAMEVAERKMPVVMMGMLFFLALSAAIFFFLQSSPSSRVEL